MCNTKCHSTATMIAGTHSMLCYMYTASLVQVLKLKTLYPFITDITEILFVLQKGLCAILKAGQHTVLEMASLMLRQLIPTCAHI